MPVALALSEPLPYNNPMTANAECALAEARDLLSKS